VAGPVPLKRTLSPSLNPTGYMAAAGTIYAAAKMIYDVTHHHGYWSTPVLIAALGTAWAFYTRFKVTPVGDPRDGNGQPMAALPLASVITGRQFPEPPAAPAPGAYGIPQAPAQPPGSPPPGSSVPSG
jgi:hypothetical protein